MLNEMIILKLAGWAQIHGAQSLPPVIFKEKKSKKSFRVLREKDAYATKHLILMIQTLHMYSCRRCYQINTVWCDSK